MTAQIAETLLYQGEEHAMFIMTAPEYRQLRRIIDSPDEMPVDGEQRDIAFARASCFKSRVGDAAFRAWMRGLLERFSN